MPLQAASACDSRSGRKSGEAQAKAQEISPDYAIRTVLGPDGETAIHLLPKTDKAQGGRPIRFTGRVSFRHNEPQDERRRQQFEDAMRFGGEAELAAANLGELTVDAPSELGISGTFPIESLKIAAHREDLDPTMRGQLTVRTPAGIPSASLPVEFTQRTTGVDGGSLYGQDITGFIQIRMRYDRRRGAWSQTLSFAPPEVALPQEMVPVLRFISRALPGQSMELTVHGPTVTQLTAPIDRAAVPDSWDTHEAEPRKGFRPIARASEPTGCGPPRTLPTRACSLTGFATRAAGRPGP
ncbi:hypothetical protein ACGFNX_14170 [Streptomyces sp. NPDC048723]|uniref:hypothetical protein n=1 Tax=Streptomyces sp. NPDC048723 TaxID=3365589 RepID=UPI0037110DAD